MIPTYLNDLRLNQILSTYTTNVEPYLQSSNKGEHIVDSETSGISGFVTTTFGQPEDLAQKYFDVRNPHGRDFCLLQIDHAAINTNATEKCDCAVMNDTDLSFIEFKANATSTKPKQVKKNYKKAMRQLKKTIGIFRTGAAALGENLLSQRTVDAYICFRKGYPRITTSEMTYRVNFAGQTGGIPLSFDGVKTI